MEDDLPDTRHRKTVHGNAWSEVVTTDLADDLADLQNLTVHCAKDQQSLVIRPCPPNLSILTVTGRSVRALAIDLSDLTDHVTVTLDHCGFREIPECVVLPLVHLSISHNPLWFHSQRMDFHTMSKHYPSSYPHPRYPEMLLELGYDGAPNFFEQHFYVYNDRVVALHQMPAEVARSRRFILLGYPKYATHVSALPPPREREWTDADIAFFAAETAMDAEDAAHLERKRAEHAAARAARAAEDVAATAREAERQRRNLEFGRQRDREADARRERQERERQLRNRSTVVKPSSFAQDSQNVHTSAANRGAREAYAFVKTFAPSKAATKYVLAEVPSLQTYLDDERNIAAIGDTIQAVAKHVCAAAYASPEMRADIRAVIQEELERPQQCGHGRTLKLLATLGGFYPEVRIGKSPSDEFRDRFATLFGRITFLAQPESAETYLETLLANAGCFAYAPAALAAMTEGNVYGGVLRLLLDANAVPATLKAEHVFATAFQEIYALKTAYPEVEPAITDAYVQSLLDAVPFEWIPLGHQDPVGAVQCAVAKHVFGAPSAPGT